MDDDLTGIYLPAKEVGGHIDCMRKVISGEVVVV
jgi:hypothetical protein